MVWDYTRFTVGDQSPFILRRDGVEAGMVQFTADVSHRMVRIRRVVEALNELDDAITDDAMVIDPVTLRLVPKVAS